MVSLSVTVASWLTFLDQESAQLLFFGSLLNSLKFVIIDAYDLTVLYHDEFSVVLLNKLLLVLQIVFKFFF